MARKLSSLLTENHKKVIDYHPNSTCFYLGDKLGIPHTTVNNYRQWKKKQYKQRILEFVDDRVHPILGYIDNQLNRSA